MGTSALTDRQARFVAQPRIGRLGTTMSDGSPHIAPIWYRYEGGAFMILTERGSQKHRNVERDDRVVLCIDDHDAPYHTVLVRGRAAVKESPNKDWRLALAIHYLGEERGRAYTSQNDSPNNVMLYIVPESVSGW